MMCEEYQEPWCQEFDSHKASHVFCTVHQIMWCRRCERHGCPDCVDDPHCPECHAAIFTEFHDWDCSYADDEVEE